MSRILMLAAAMAVLGGCTATTNGLGGERNLASYMYLRGVFSGWEALDEFQLQPLGNQRYAVDTQLTADGNPYYFKFADAGWVMGSNCGPLADDVVEPGKTVTANCSEGRRSFRFTPTATGRYRFLFDNSGDQPEVTVEVL